jgi:hypothetical protein
MSPGTVALLCLIALPVAFAAACLIAWQMYRAAPGRRWSAIVMWDKPGALVLCVACNGWGDVRLDGTPYPAGLSGAEKQHLVAAQAGNSRSCRGCAGRGYVTSAWPKPRLPQSTEGPG